MSETDKRWDGETVRTWLDGRLRAAASEQERADRLGRGHEDEYDKAAAEEWACRAARASAAIGDQAAFAALLKGLLGQDEYRRPGVHDDRRFEREVRACLRRMMTMTKANAGFENLSRYQ